MDKPRHPQVIRTWVLDRARSRRTPLRSAVNPGGRRPAPAPRGKRTPGPPDAGAR
jgi:hypothetical protein